MNIKKNVLSVVLAGLAFYSVHAMEQKKPAAVFEDDPLLQVLNDDDWNRLRRDGLRKYLAMIKDGRSCEHDALIAVQANSSSDNVGVQEVCFKILIALANKGLAFEQAVQAIEHYLERLKDGYQAYRDRHEHNLYERIIELCCALVKQGQAYELAARVAHKGMNCRKTSPISMMTRWWMSLELYGELFKQKQAYQQAAVTAQALLKMCDENDDAFIQKEYVKRAFCLYERLVHSGQAIPDALQALGKYRNVGACCRHLLKAIHDVGAITCVVTPADDNENLASVFMAAYNFAGLVSASMS